MQKRKYEVNSYNKLGRLRGEIPESVKKLEHDYQKIHDAYFNAVATGDSNKSALAAMRYRKFFQSEK